MMPARIQRILKATVRAVPLLVLLVIASGNRAQLRASENCDMAAMTSRATLGIARYTDQPGTFDDPNDFFDFLIQRSTSNTNPDGYGIVSADADGLFPNPSTIAGQAEVYSSRGWYVKALDTGVNAYHFILYPGPMQAARTAIVSADTDTTIVLGHVRNASSSAVGSHPFRFEYGGKVYAFMHNGSIRSDIKSALYGALGGSAWFDQHPPNWIDDYGRVANLVDTEVLFHWLMSWIMTYEGDVFRGVLEALTTTVGGYHLEDEFRQNYASNTVNFVLSDGESLYLFRNSAVTGPKLSWAEPQPGLVMVKTQDELQNPLDQFDFVRISRYGPSSVLSSFLDYDPAHFVSGKVGNETWNSTVYVVNDTLVPMDATVHINDSVQFINHAEFVINGKLNLQTDAEIHLTNDSTIVVEDRAAALGLTWSSEISCAPLGTDLTALPSECTTAESLARGDCLIARHGEVIATKINPPHPPCSPVPYKYQTWQDYCRLWNLSRLLRHCSCR